MSSIMLFKQGIQRRAEREYPDALRHQQGYHVREIGDLGRGIARCVPTQKDDDKRDEKCVDQYGGDSTQNKTQRLFFDVFADKIGQ